MCRISTEAKPEPQCKTSLVKPKKMKIFQTRKRKNLQKKKQKAIRSNSGPNGAPKQNSPPLPSSITVFEDERYKKTVVTSIKRRNCKWALEKVMNDNTNKNYQMTMVVEVEADELLEVLRTSGYLFERQPVTPEFLSAHTSICPTREEVIPIHFSNAVDPSSVTRSHSTDQLRNVWVFKWQPSSSDTKLCD